MREDKATGYTRLMRHIRTDSNLSYKYTGTSFVLYSNRVAVIALFLVHEAMQAKELCVQLGIPSI